ANFHEKRLCSENGLKYSQESRFPGMSLTAGNTGAGGKGFARKKQKNQSYIFSIALSLYGIHTIRNRREQQKASSITPIKLKSTDNYSKSR
ncbi:MAG TPA: hypothetical protein PLP17_08220, partial [Oligoflexia bacterium]|nr:hypothetical protein [Oligoflexia bacterium]